jgi:hypothetical protein
MRAKSKGWVITDAFLRVSIAPLYRDRWITAYDWVRIINHAHGVLPENLERLNVSTLVRSLRGDARCRGAEDSSGVSGLFRKHYSPQHIPDGSSDDSSSRVMVHYGRKEE